VTRVMDLADRVITADATTRDRVVARGLDPEKVTLVPIDGDPAKSGAAIRTLYADVAARHRAGKPA
jgi:type IV pilus biogenesis protein CpaD/CtpE